MSEMQKKLGVTVFILEIERVENYPNFEKLAHVIQHGLQGFIVKNITGESTEANDLSRILYKWVCYVNNFKFYRCFHKNQSFRRHLKPLHQWTKSLKGTVFGGV